MKPRWKSWTEVVFWALMLVVFLTQMPSLHGLLTGGATLSTGHWVWTAVNFAGVLLSINRLGRVWREL